MLFKVYPQRQPLWCPNVAPQDVEVVFKHCGFIQPHFISIESQTLPERAVVQLAKVTLGADGLEAGCRRGEVMSYTLLRTRRGFRHHPWSPDNIINEDG